MRLLPAVAAAALAATALATPAHAGSNVTITASPTQLRPGEATTVAITSNCNSAPYTVTLAYTQWDNTTATATASGTTDASGEATQAITVPENAYSRQLTTVTASADGCGGSNTVELDLRSYDGELTISPESGPQGTEVIVEGTNCWGDAVIVRFGDNAGDGDNDGDDEVYDIGTPDVGDDRTFELSYTIPEEAGPGLWRFTARCPGTEFLPATFRVTEVTDEGEGGNEGEGTGGGEGAGGGGGVPTAPPAVPMPGVVTVTG
jgi:hypothetical protein